mmetsp:Transcript_38387/g.96359  ORF Transcript_38387/g.96359 Transcript_38387/m.96359 type:complete len:213 (+) Transcript_38387:98-736(+)
MDDLTVFVGNLPFSVTEMDVRRDFENCGTITDFRFPFHQDTGKPKGFAIITYATRDGAQNALKMHETDYDGRTIFVRLDGAKGKGKGKGKSDKGYGKGKGDAGDWGKGKGKGRKGPRDLSEMPQGCQSVIVKNLSYDTVEDTLHDVFQDCGAIERVNILTDRDTGRSRGIGFIDFETPEGASRAMSKFDEVVDGRAIYVDWSERKGGGKGKW